MDNLYGSKYVSATNQQTSEKDNVKLLLAITGTLNEPLVTMGYYLNEQSQPYASSNLIGGKTSQIDPNAELNVISMLLSKQWYARPGSSAQASNIAVTSVGMSAGSGLLSSQFSKVIQDIAGLESFNVNVGMDKRVEKSSFGDRIARDLARAFALRAGRHAVCAPVARGVRRRDRAVSRPGPGSAQDGRV